MRKSLWILALWPALAWGQGVSPAPGVQASGGNASNTVVTATGGATARTLADIAKLTTQCYGVTADGTTDDTAAFQACKTAAASGVRITLPIGDMSITGFPTGASLPLWYLPGTTFNGGNPLSGIGTDVLEGSLNGGKWFRRGATTADIPPMIRNDLSATHTGGTAGFVIPNVQDNCTVPLEAGGLNNQVWCHQSNITSSAYGSGGHIALSGSAFRPSNALSDSNGPRTQLWGGYFEVNDQTGSAANLSGSAVGNEIDIYANGDDPAGATGHRIVLDLNIGRSNPAGAPMRAISGITLARNDSVSYFGTEISITAPWDTAGIDTSSTSPTVSTAPAVRIGTGQTMAFDASNNFTLGESSGALVLTPGSGSNPLGFSFNGGTNTINILPTAAANVAIGGVGGAALYLGNGGATYFTGSAIFNGATSGTVTVNAPAIAGSTTVILTHEANSQSQPGNKTAPDSTAAYKMQGLAGAITPASSGTILIIVSGTVVAPAGTTAGLGINYQLSYGTGTAPSNAGTLAGTQVGAIQTYENTATVVAADVHIPFSTQAVVTGLAVGTAYWIDLAAESVGTISDMGLANVSVSAIELQ